MHAVENAAEAGAESTVRILAAVCDPNRALCAAARLGLCDLARDALQRGAAFDHWMFYGCDKTPPLAVAVIYGHSSLVRDLCEVPRAALNFSFECVFRVISQKGLPHDTLPEIVALLFAGHLVAEEIRGMIRASKGVSHRGQRRLQPRQSAPTSGRRRLQNSVSQPHVDPVQPAAALSPSASAGACFMAVARQRW